MARPVAPLLIETPRLSLRPPTASDAGAIFERYASDREVTRFLAWPTHTTPDDTRSFLAFAAAEWRRWPAGPYLIFDRSNGTLLGSTGLTFESPDCASVGYVIARDSWGRGYATEALQAMVDLGPALWLRRLYAVCHVDHHASACVLDKAGFTFERVLPSRVTFPNLDPEAPADVRCFGMVFPSAEEDAGQ